jgi:hypothetical protein
MRMRIRTLWNASLLLLLAIQLGCSTHAPQPPAPPEQSSETGASEPQENATQESATAESTEQAKQPEAPRLPESVVTGPETELASLAVKYDTVLMSRTLEAPATQGWDYRLDRKGRIVGFEFSNHGGNAVLPERYDIQKDRLFTRDFHFYFDDRARQNIHTFISDWAPSRDKQFRLSELMNSVLMFFPRSNLPAISRSGESYIVTLATGEEVEFNARTREIRSGVLSEGPVDLNPIKEARRYPEVNYTGKGVLVRANARGSDPRIGTQATITTGSPPADCDRADGCNRCTVQAKELWAQSGSVAFKFATDAEFDRFLLERCGFGLPKDGVNFALAGVDHQTVR